jgi:uncharacterized membrane protein YhaH (DUF805 family)
MGPAEAIYRCLRQYGTFSGRSSRSEFWWWMASLVFVGTLEHFMKVFILVTIMMLVPTLAVSVRRLQDANWPAWWIFTSFIPLLGFLFLSCLFMKKGSSHLNKYGPPSELQLLSRANTMSSSVTLEEPETLTDTKYLPEHEGESTPADPDLGFLANLNAVPLKDVVILVHGTFASKAQWIDETSALSETIRIKCEGIRIEPFRWCGSNSPSARIKAGQDLAEAGKLLYTQGYNRIWLVGHSHGGDVIMRALRNKIMKKVVCGVWFLGTPFLEVSLRPVGKISATITKTISWLILFPGIMPLGSFAIINFSSVVFGNVVAAFFLLIGNGLITLAYFMKREIFQRWMELKLSARLIKRQKYSYERLRQIPPTCPAVISFVRLDEAGLLLKIWDAIALAPWRFHEVAAQLLTTITLSYIATIFITKQFFGDGYINANEGTYIFYVAITLPLFVVAAPFAITAAVVIIRGSPLAFGYEGIIAASTLRIKPETIPSWSTRGRYEIFCSSSTKKIKGLRHSMFYSNTEVINKCAEWIESSRTGQQFSALQSYRSLHIPDAVAPAVKIPKWMLVAIAALVIGAELVVASHIAS